jgi:hypothetical protein
MVAWSSSFEAPVTFRNRVRASDAFPAATFSARAIWALMALSSRLLRLSLLVT